MWEFDIIIIIDRNTQVQDNETQRYFIAFVSRLFLSARLQKRKEKRKSSNEKQSNIIFRRVYSRR